MMAMVGSSDSLIVFQLFVGDLQLKARMLKVSVHKYLVDIPN
jgi:hypothetical protein